MTFYALRIVALTLAIAIGLAAHGLEPKYDKASGPTGAGTAATLDLRGV